MHVPWLNEILSSRITGCGRSDRSRAVGCGDAGGDAVGSLDGDRECGALPIGGSSRLKLKA
jgi:hypothetical protein